MIITLECSVNGISSNVLEQLHLFTMFNRHFQSHTEPRTEFSSYFLYYFYIFNFHFTIRDEKNRVDFRIYAKEFKSASGQNSTNPTVQSCTNIKRTGLRPTSFYSYRFQCFIIKFAAKFREESQTNDQA